MEAYFHLSITFIMLCVMASYVSNVLNLYHSVINKYEDMLATTTM